MDCVKAQQLIRPYLNGYLSDRDLEDFLDHVQSCPDCFDELEVYFSVYRTLQDVDEKGDYNFRKKLRRRLEGSRGYLRRRSQSKALRAAVILVAEFALVAAFWVMLFLPGTYNGRMQGMAGQGGQAAADRAQTEEWQEEETPADRG